MKRFKLFLLLVMAIVVSLPAFSADKVDSKIRFNDLYGEVSIRPNSEDDDAYEYAELDTIIYEEDRIRTKEDSGAILGLEDMSTYVIKPETTLIIHTEEGNVSKIEMLAGAMWANIKKMSEGKTLEVEMSQCVAGITGTVFMAEHYGNSDAISVTHGKILLTSKINGLQVEVEEGQTVIMDDKGNVLQKEIDADKEKSFLDQLDKTNDELDLKTIKEKLENKIKEIDGENSKLNSALNNMKSEASTKSIDDLKNSLAKEYNDSLQEGKRFVGVYKEVNSIIKSYAAREGLNKKDVTERSNCIKKAKESMEKLNKTIFDMETFLSKLSKEIEGSSKINNDETNTGTQTDKDSKEQEEILNEVNEINEESNSIIRDIGEQSSYQDFENAVNILSALRIELGKISTRINALEQSNDNAKNSKAKLLKFYELVDNTIAKALQDFSSVPKIESAEMTQMSNFDENIPNYAASIREYLNKYNAISTSSDTSKQRYVEAVTRTLASYDRMRRVYTKAEKLYNQINRKFSQAAFKSSEYQEVYDSWLRISDAMNELDKDASELSSCVDDLKEQLQSVIK